jgi:hypothetical protein
MNISQPFSHRPIATSLQFHNRANDQIIDAEPFNDAIIAYRNGAAQSGFATSARRRTLYMAKSVCRAGRTRDLGDTSS